jgi:hypothetical protein
MGERIDFNLKTPTFAGQEGKISVTKQLSIFFQNRMHHILFSKSKARQLQGCLSFDFKHFIIHLPNHLNSKANTHERDNSS